MNRSIAVRHILDVVLVIALAIASLFASARVGLQPREPENGVAVVFAPWTSAERTLARATDPDGRFVRYGGFPFIAVVIPETADYSERMLAGGALLVLDPQALAACLRNFNQRAALQ